MGVLINLRRISSCLFLVFFSLTAEANDSPKKGESKGRQLAQAIQKASQESYKKQVQIRQRIADETQQRLDAHRERDFKFKNIKKVKTARKSSLKPIQLSRPDFRYEDVGEDQSGLNSLHGDDFQDYEDNNIDQELREISSLSD